jgi:hypothetical protein
VDLEAKKVKPPPVVEPPLVVKVEKVEPPPVVEAEKVEPSPVVEEAGSR